MYSGSCHRIEVFGQHIFYGWVFLYQSLLKSLKKKKTVKKNVDISFVAVEVI